MPKLHPFATLAAAIAVGFVSTAAATTGAKRAFTIAAVEPKGGANVEKEPFPAPPPEGSGLAIKEPNAEGRWEVSTYLWSAAQIVVHEGDEVALTFVGVNGGAHPTTIEGYDKAFTLKRGGMETVSFVADKAGAFKIVCATHKPTMVSELVVLPRK